MTTKSAAGKWQPPQQGWVKLNTDAATARKSNAIAVVARDHKGDVLKIWARIIPPCSPTQAEASAIYWATQLAKAEKWTHIIIEGDDKSCFDSLNSLSITPDWTISNIIAKTLSLKDFFLSCFSRWAKRDSNTVAHIASRLSLSSSTSFSYNKHSSPNVLKSACKVDCSSVVCPSV